MPLINACSKGTYYGGTLGEMKNFEVLSRQDPPHLPPYTRQTNFITKFYRLSNASICSTWIA